jgi:uncharacterized protein (TIGR02118 family)
MIKLTVLYPNDSDSKFDWDYYLGTHVPLAKEKIGPAVLSVSVDQGLAGGTPGEPPPYTAIFRMTFESLQSFQEAFGPVAPDLVADLPNFTNVQPTIQLSEVKL